MKRKVKGELTIIEPHLGVVRWRFWIPGFIVPVDLDVVAGLLVPEYHLRLR